MTMIVKMSGSTPMAVVGPFAGAVLAERTVRRLERAEEREQRKMYNLAVAQGECCRFAEWRSHNVFYRTTAFAQLTVKTLSA